MVAESTSSHSSAGETTDSGSTASQVMALVAVLKASQALSGERELEPLVAKLLHVVAATAGADQCALMLLQEGEWIVTAVRQRDQSIARPLVPLDASRDVPIALIQSVQRSLEPAVIAHVDQHPTLLADPYIARQQPQSVLCTPMLHQGKLLGLLYLENHVTAGAFTHDRVELLTLLCAQAAISIENAQLYAREQGKTQALQVSLNQLQQAEWRFQALFEQSADAILLLGSNGFINCNQAAVNLFGCDHKDQLCNLYPSNLSPALQPDHQPSFDKAEAMIAQAISKGSHQFEWMHQRTNGENFWAEVMLTVMLDDGEQVVHSLVRDISDRKRGEAERQQADAQLRQQAQVNQLLASIAQTINQSVRLDQVLEGCLEQVRQFFQSDRVIICRFDAAYNVVIELEALSQPELSLLGQTIDDPCFDRGWAERYRQGYVTVCHDSQVANLTPCYAAFLTQMQVRANVVVGILQGDEIWGLMIVHHCHKLYEWQQSEIDLLKQLGLQIGIANQKAILYTQLEAELAERRRTESALRLSEERYRCLTNVTTQLLWTTDAAGQVVEDLPSWRAYTGQSLEAIKDAGAFQALHPDDYEHVLQAWTHAVQTQNPYRLECRVRSTDGSYRYFDVQGVPVLAEDGSIREWMGACVDIDDRKQAEQQLQASQQLLELVLNTIPHKVFWKDRDSNLLGWNRAFAEVIGCNSPAELAGKTDDDMPWTTEEEEGYRECDRRVMAADLPELGIIETQLQADGSLAWIETSKMPLHDATGNVIGLLGVYQDITDRKQAEAAQARLIAILEATTDMVGMADAAGNNLYLNQAGQQLLEIPAEAMNQFHIATVIVPGMREMTQTVVLPTAIARGSWTGETILLTRSNEEIPVSQVIVAHKNEQGQVEFFSTIMRDIRDRKQAEADLQEKEQFLRTIYDGAEMVIFVIDALDDGSFRYAGWNAAAERVTGVRGVDVAGKTLTEIHGEHDGRQLGRRCAETVATGMSLVYEDCLTFDGQETWWFATQNPVKDADGRVYRIIGTTFNITDRKQAEAALQKSLQERKYQARLLQTVLDSTQAWIFAKDQNFRYIMVNRSYAAAIGQTVETILGRDDLELGFPEPLVLGDPAQNIRGFRTDDRRALAGEVVHNPYDPATIADGSQRIFDTLKSPLYSTGGDIFAMLGFCNDVTELKHAETQLRSQKQALEETLQALQRTQSQMVQSEKMSGLGQLVAGVAHEINNPVNFIYGNLTHANSYTTDLLRLLALYQKHDPTPHAEIQTEVEAIDLDFLLEDLPKLLASMRVGAERIQKIVASLRNFSRMDEAEVKAVNLHEGIDSTLMILQHRLKATPEHPGIQVIKEYSTLPLVECYAGQLNQVFMNVLSNAIDALEENLEQKRDFQPIITIRTLLSDQQQIQISFADNGSGIPDAVKSRLFNPFFTTKPVGKGTGMGLSISHQIVTEKHGGSMQCVSAPGQGTEFIIEIPIQRL